MTAGLAGSSTPRSMLNSTSTHSSSASRMASTRPTFTPRRVTGAPTPSPPTVRNRAWATMFCSLTSVSLSQSAPATTTASASSTVSPTANSFVRFMDASSSRGVVDELRTGSVVAWISAMVPTWRIWPSYSIAMRSPTVKALRRSWVTTSPVTPRSRGRAP